MTAPIFYVLDNDDEYVPATFLINPITGQLGRDMQMVLIDPKNNSNILQKKHQKSVQHFVQQKISTCS